MVIHDINELIGISAPRTVDMRQVRSRLRRWVKNTVQNPPPVEVVKHLREKLSKKRSECRELLTTNAKLQYELDTFENQKRYDLEVKDGEIDRITDLYNEYREKYEDKIHADRDEMIVWLKDECNYKLEELKQYESWEIRVLFEQ